MTAAQQNYESSHVRTIRRKHHFYTKVNQLRKDASYYKISLATQPFLYVLSFFFQQKLPIE